MRQKRITLLIVGIIVVVLFIIGLIFSARPSSNTEQSGQPFTGNQNPKADYQAPTTATVDGLDALVTTESFTLDQTAAVRTAFQSYPPFNNAHTNISIATNDLQPVPPAQSDPLYRPSILSHITVNQGATYPIRIYFWGTSSIELFIYNGTTQLFDSGKVVGKS